MRIEEQGDATIWAGCVEPRLSAACLSRFWGLKIPPQSSSTQPPVNSPALRFGDVKSVGPQRKTPGKSRGFGSIRNARGSPEELRIQSLRGGSTIRVHFNSRKGLAAVFGYLARKCDVPAEPVHTPEMYLPLGGRGCCSCQPSCFSFRDVFRSVVGHKGSSKD